MLKLIKCLKKQQQAVTLPEEAFYIIPINQSITIVKKGPLQQPKSVT